MSNLIDVAAAIRSLPPELYINIHREFVVKAHSDDKRNILGEKWIDNGHWIVVIALPLLYRDTPDSFYSIIGHQHIGGNGENVDLTEALKEALDGFNDSLAQRAAETGETLDDLLAGVREKARAFRPDAADDTER